MPSFLHPVIVRAVKTSHGAKLEAIVLGGHGGYDLGEVVVKITVELSGSQWNDLERHLEAATFWEMPTKLADDSGSDGDQHVFEGVKDGKYHVVDRWFPDPAYTALCRYMLDLTGFKTQKVWEEYHSIEPSP